MKTRWFFHNLTSHFPSPSSLLASETLKNPSSHSQTSTLVLNHVDLSRLLPRYGTALLGSSIHASIVKNPEFHGSENLETLRNVLVVWNSLLCSYSNQRLDAAKLFDDMPVRDTVSWNTVISGFLRNGQLGIGFRYFKVMRELGCDRFDQSSLTAILSGFDVPEFLSATEMVHCLVFQSGYEDETTVGNALITSYLKCECSNSGRQVFEEMVERNVITWTALVSGLVWNEYYEESLRLLLIMRRGNVCPNSLTYLSSLMACAGLQGLSEGRQIHGLLWKLGIESCLRVESALMDMYSKCGSIEDAWRVFEAAKEPDEVAMTVILVGFAQNGFEEEAIQIFKKMVKTGIEIDPNVVSAVLGVFGNDTSLGLGKQIHALIFKKNFSHNTYVGNGIINMYSKCGELEDSVKVFNEMTQRNSISWNSMIAAYARHGDGLGALELYEIMKLESVKPTDITFLSLLHACSHVGLVEKGMELLSCMSKDHGMNPRPEHHACIVDLLGRAGLLNEAKHFIEALPEKPGPLVWQALLGSCSFHSDSELGKFAAEQLFEALPESPASYVLLANIYSSEGKWRERARTIKRMKEMGVPKDKGISWIEIEKKVHSFVVCDKLHPQADAIYGVLVQLFQVMTDEGYVPDKRFILYYCDQDEKG